MTPWAVARQSPLSMGFSRQEYWSGSPCPPPGDLPNPGIELMVYFVFMLQDTEILQSINIKLLSKLHFFPEGSVFPQILSFACHLHDFFDISHAINTASYGKGVDF